MLPVASIVIPAYNAAKTVVAAIKSARHQTLDKVEIIVVDDGSSDDTKLILGQQAAIDARVRVLTCAVTSGPSVARNMGISAARGRWIVLLDADDTIVPMRIDALIQEAEARELDLLADNLMLIDAATAQPLGQALDPVLMSSRQLVSLTDLLAADWPGKNRTYRTLGVAKPIIRRSFIAERGLRYDPEVKLGEDLLFYSCLLASGARFGLTPACGYLYTTNASTISRRTIPTMELVEVNAKIRELLGSPGAPRHRELLALLERRDAALRFQVFTWSIRTRRFRSACAAAQSISPLAFLSLAFEKGFRRSSMNPRAQDPQRRQA